MLPRQHIAARDTNICVRKCAWENGRWRADSTHTTDVVVGIINRAQCLHTLNDTSVESNVNWVEEGLYTYISVMKRNRMRYAVLRHMLFSTAQLQLSIDVWKHYKFLFYSQQHAMETRKIIMWHVETWTGGIMFLHVYALFPSHESLLYIPDENNNMLSK